jgi:hypothetical protein
MKKILVIAFLTLTSMSMQAQEELTWHTDMSKATDISIKDNKPMFLFFTGSAHLCRLAQSITVKVAGHHVQI